MNKNFRKIPAELLVKIKGIKSNAIVAGCAVKFKAETLMSGRLEHLGVTLTVQGLQFPTAIIPPATQGRFSKWNIEGVEIVRKDLAKQTAYNAVEAPNWGDSFKGTHTVYLPYERYPREFKPPRELEISIACMDSQPGLSAYIMLFKVNEVLDKTNTHFKDRLFENLNILQENVGSCGVEPAEVSLVDYAKSLHVSWELLPPGTREDAIDRLFRGRAPSKEEKEVAVDRYEFFISLNPKRLVYGKSGFRRYFGALIEDNLVVFENIQYGNAVYVLFDNWEELSKRSRIDLLSGKYGRDFKRIIHLRGWKGEVRAIVAAKRNEKKKKS